MNHECTKCGKTITDSERIEDEKGICLDLCAECYDLDIASDDSDTIASKKGLRNS